MYNLFCLNLPARLAFYFFFPLFLGFSYREPEIQSNWNVFMDFRGNFSSVRIKLLIHLIPSLCLNNHITAQSLAALTSWYDCSSQTESIPALLAHSWGYWRGDSCFRLESKQLTSSIPSSSKSTWHAFFMLKHAQESLQLFSSDTSRLDMSLFMTFSSLDEKQWNKCFIWNGLNLCY